MSIDNVQNDRPIEPSNEAVIAAVQSSRPDQPRKRILLRSIVTLGGILTLSNLGAGTVLAQEEQDGDTVAQAGPRVELRGRDVALNGIVVTPNNDEFSPSSPEYAQEQQEAETTVVWLDAIRRTANASGVAGLKIPLDNWFKDNGNPIGPKLVAKTITFSSRTNPRTSPGEAGFSFPVNVHTYPYVSADGSKEFVIAMMSITPADIGVFNPNDAFAAMELAKKVAVFNRDSTPSSNDSMRKKVVEELKSGVPVREVADHFNLKNYPNRFESEWIAFRDSFRMWPQVQAAVEKGLLGPSPWYEEAFQEWRSLEGNVVKELEFVRANRFKGKENTISDDLIQSVASRH